MRNTLKTTVLLAGFAGLLLFVGQLVGGQSGLIFAAVIAFVMVGGSYWFCDKLALRSANAHVISVPLDSSVNGAATGVGHQVMSRDQLVDVLMKGIDGRVGRGLHRRHRTTDTTSEEVAIEERGRRGSSGLPLHSEQTERRRSLDEILAEQTEPDAALNRRSRDSNFSVPARQAQLEHLVCQPEFYDRARGLVEMTAELAQLAGIPMPRVAISLDLQPNAFATGRNPRKGVVCATVGLFETLDRYELRGVMAHEMAHIRNRDILIGSVAAAVATMITFVARMAMFAAIFSGGRDNERHPIGDLVLVLLAPIAAALIQMAISRSREMQADRSAARMIGDGEPLARALEKIHLRCLSVHSIADDNQAQMYIVNPLADRKRHFSQLFRTHPPMEERIRRLRDGSWRDF